MSDSFECTFTLKHFDAINQNNEIETPIKLVSSEGKKFHFNRNVLAIYSSFVYWEVKKNEFMRELHINFSDDTSECFEWLFVCGEVTVFDNEISNDLFGLLLHLQVDLDNLVITNNSNRYTLPEYLKELKVFEIEDCDQGSPDDEVYNRGRQTHLKLKQFFSESEKYANAIPNGFYCMFLQQCNNNLDRFDLCYSGKFSYNFSEENIKSIFQRPLSHFDRFIQYHFYKNGMGLEPKHQIYKHLTEKWIKKNDSLKPVLFAQRDLGYAGELVEGALFRLVIKTGIKKRFKYFINTKRELMIDDSDFDDIFVDEDTILDFAHYHLTNILNSPIVQEIAHVSYKYENMKQFTCSKCNLLCLTVDDRMLHENMNVCGNK